MTNREGVDVLVVGAGPSGAVVSKELAGRGLRVLTIDRASFPRPKPCGESVNPGAVAILKRLNLLTPVLATHPARLRGWRVRGATGNGFAGRYPVDDLGVGISRVVFDNVLVREAVRAGVLLQEKTTATGFRKLADGWRVELRSCRGTSSIHTRLLVGADGLRSRVARSLGLVKRQAKLKKVSVTCHVEGERADDGFGTIQQTGTYTLGVAPNRGDTGMWNVTVVVNSDRRGRELAGDAARFHNHIVQRSGFFPAGHRIVAGPWASGPFDRPVDRAVFEHGLLVGDAAGYFDPFTGQGVCQALRSGELAAACIVDLFQTDRPWSDRLMRYDRDLRRDRRPVYAFQRMAEFFLGGSGLRTASLMAGRMPGMADRIIRVAGDRAPLRTLIGLA